MAISRLRTSFFKVCLGICLVLLAVLFAAEIFYGFPDGDYHFDDAADPADLVNFQENSEGFHSEGEAKKFDFLEVDENWIDRYSEGGLAFVVTILVGCNGGCRLTETFFSVSIKSSYIPGICPHQLYARPGPRIPREAGTPSLIGMLFDTTHDIEI